MQYCLPIITRRRYSDVADFIGDSLGLAQEAAKNKSGYYRFRRCAFMAETAKILNPNKKVLLPDLAAGCSLADSCPPENLGIKAKYPASPLLSLTSIVLLKLRRSVILFAPQAMQKKYIIRSSSPDQK